MAGFILTLFSQTTIRNLIAGQNLSSIHKLWFEISSQGGNNWLPADVLASRLHLMISYLIISLLGACLIFYVIWIKLQKPPLSPPLLFEIQHKASFKLQPPTEFWEGHRLLAVVEADEDSSWKGFLSLISICWANVERATGASPPKKVPNSL